MCDFNQELLQEYIDGELDKLETVLLEEHLKTCPECRREMNRLKILDWDLRFSNNFTIPYNELEELRIKTFKLCFSESVNPGEEDTNSLADVYRIQNSSFQLAVGYMHFLPGAGLIKTAGNLTKNYVGKKLNLLKITSR